RPCGSDRRRRQRSGFRVSHRRRKCSPPGGQRGRDSHNLLRQCRRAHAIARVARRLTRMRAVLIRLDAETQNGYPVALFEGEEQEMLARAAADAPADVVDMIPLDLATKPAPRGTTFIDLKAQARTVLAAADGMDDSLRDLGMQLFALLDRGQV